MVKVFVFSKVRSVFGFDYCYFFISGVAFFSYEIFEFFLSLDIFIGEMYGMSESLGFYIMFNYDNYRVLRYRFFG